MKAMWRAEAFGWGNRARRRNRRLPAGQHRPWVAEITGLSRRYGLQREFLEGKTDWTQMSSSGDRGVYLCWTLEQGKVYETRYFVSWSQAVRFPFFRRGMEFEDFVPAFGHWYATGGDQDSDPRLTACLVGIRSQESLNRWRTIATQRKRRHDGLAWTTWLGGHLVNAYPIYDWATEDIWRSFGVGHAARAEHVF